MTKKISLLAVFFVSSSAVMADRPLERAEILKIFETLTSQPQKTWIPSGTICTRHEEYRAPQKTDPQEIDNAIDAEVRKYLDNTNKLELTEKLQQMKLAAIPFNVRYTLSNEYTMVSDTIVRFDGTRFYWEINVVSRRDSVSPPAEVAGNSLTEQFDLDWNRKRVFAWDGEKYVNYFRPGNHATITKAPSGVNGPLTAGIIPWGYGRYTLDSLLGAESSGTEVESGGGPEIHLTTINGDCEETFVLDAAKDYAVKLYSATSPNIGTIVQRYENHRVIGGKWYPGKVIIERYEISGEGARLLNRDVWNFSLISNVAPEPGSFDVSFEYDAFIEDFRFGDKPLQFRYSPPNTPSVKNVDLNKLLQTRLEIAFSTESGVQNCATTSLKYVCEELGVSPSWAELGGLVHGAAKSTNMFEMQQFIRNQGLNSVSVEAELELLGALGNCQVILHLRADNHFVVLANVDDKYVRLIDLDRNNFYYRTTIEHFKTIWDRTAMVLAKNPITIKGCPAEIDDSRLRKVIGAGTCAQCTVKLQNNAEFSCTVIGGFCLGAHSVYYERWGCGSASSGTCDETSMIKKKSEPCLTNPSTFECTGNGDWTITTMLACG
ncbi:MAG TPA: cysteine peptidase family C39 domain-containing protein [Sedimentisphaerales bacterium]|nr:cysteine peptidase family C39 domain-containing protein [Sedimentisphaerales bacterium]